MKNRFAKALTSTITVIILITTVLFFNDAVSAVASSNNSCGENTSYTFDSEKGLLTVQGTGSMENYFVNSDSENGSQNPPWYAIRNEIKSVKINDGITDVGQFAFYDCKNLKKVEIADSVSSIGRDAFDECANLSEVSFSKGLKEIGEWAFQSCKMLRSINIPSGVETIGRSAFSDTGLESIVVPETVKNIYRNAFTGCVNLSNVKLPSTLKELVRGVFSDCTSLKRIVIPDSVVLIGREAFYGCTGLVDISIPDSVKSIGSWAFCNCINLNKIAFSPNVTSIDEGAFENTGFYNNKNNWDNRALYLNGFLVSLDSSFKGDFIIKRGTNGIASKAFNDCPELTSVTVPESVKYTSGVMFVSCPKLKNVKFLGNELKYDEYFILFRSDEPTVECIKNSDIYKYAVEKGLKLSLIVKNSESVTTINETSASSEQVSETVSAKVTVTIPETEKVNTELKFETPDGSRSNKPLWIAAAVFVVVIIAAIIVLLTLKKKKAVTDDKN